MRFNSLIVFLTIITCFSTYAQEGNKTSDLEYLRLQLPILHNNLFHKITREGFNNQLDLLKEKVENLTDLEFAFKLQSIIAKVGDSHSNIDFSTMLDKKEIYPIKFYWLKDGFYVIAIEKDYEKLLGQKLIAINNISINEIMKRCEDIIVKDNEAIMKQKLPNLIISKEVLDFLDITNEGNNTFSFDSGLNRIDVEISTLSELNRFPNYIQIKPASIPLSLMHPKEYFWYELKKENNVLYAQYNTCWGKEAELKYGSGSVSKANSLPSFNEFSDSIFNILSNNKISKFVFDLRFNTGGSSPQGTEFANKIASFAQINKKGKLFVVLGRGTFSSAILNALDFKIVHQPYL